MPTTKIRKSIYQVVEKSLAFKKFIVALIVLNILMIILESFDNLYNEYQVLFNMFEIMTVVIFSIEYIARIVVADYTYSKGGAIKSILTYVFSPMAIIDLLAIIPFYLPFLIAFDLRFIRAFRLVRVARIFRLSRYSKALESLYSVFRKEKEKLVITISATFVLLLISSIVMYYVEGGIQPEKFPNVLAAMWWAVATLTTVGYGDVYPVTAIGKILSAIVTLLGIGIVALPTGIISSGFINELNKSKKNLVYCPHCKEKL